MKPGKMSKRQDSEITVTSDLSFSLTCFSNRGRASTSQATTISSSTDQKPTTPSSGTQSQNHSQNFPQHLPNIQPDQKIMASPRSLKECTACTSPFPELSLLKVPCACLFCAPCLNRIFQAAATTELLFPAKCHGEPIPLDRWTKVLTPETLKLYQRRYLETATENRVYCAKIECRKFLPLPQYSTSALMCEDCGTTTCAVCKELGHAGEICPSVLSDEEFLEYAREQGWKRCYKCRRVVELHEGCMHVKCVTCS